MSPSDAIRAPSQTPTEPPTQDLGPLAKANQEDLRRYQSDERIPTNITPQDLLAVAGELGQQNGLSPTQTRVLGCFVITTDACVPWSMVAIRAQVTRETVARCFSSAAFRTALIDAGGVLVLAAQPRAVRALVQTMQQGEDSGAAVRAATELTRTAGVTAGEVVVHEHRGEVAHVHDTLARWMDRLGLGPIPSGPLPEADGMGPRALGPVDGRADWQEDARRQVKDERDADRRHKASGQGPEERGPGGAGTQPGQREDEASSE